MNKMYFENGIVHDFTDDEMKLLRLMISGKDSHLPNFSTYDDSNYDEVCSRFDTAFDSLRSLFCVHLD